MEFLELLDQFFVLVSGNRDIGVDRVVCVVCVVAGDGIIVVVVVVDVVIVVHLVVVVWMINR